MGESLSEAGGGAAPGPAHTRPLKVNPPIKSPRTSAPAPPASVLHGRLRWRFCACGVRVERVRTWRSKPMVSTAEVVRHQARVCENASEMEAPHVEAIEA